MFYLFLSPHNPILHSVSWLLTVTNWCRILWIIRKEARSSPMTAAPMVDREVRWRPLSRDFRRPARDCEDERNQTSSRWHLFVQKSAEWSDGNLVSVDSIGFMFHVSGYFTRVGVLEDAGRPTVVGCPWWIWDIWRSGAGHSKLWKMRIRSWWGGGQTRQRGDLGPDGTPWGTRRPVGNSAEITC